MSAIKRPKCPGIDQDGNECSGKAGHFGEHGLISLSREVAQFPPSVEHVLQFFTYEHLLPEHLQAVLKATCRLAYEMATTLPGNPETAEGLRKLLEAKDCFVRAKLAGGAS